MVKFIFFCMALTALSFAIIPIFFGISKEHDKLIQTFDAKSAVENELTFEQIYTLVDAGILIDPAMLNAIVPAAGGEVLPEKFSTGFSGEEDSALAE